MTLNNDTARLAQYIPSTPVRATSDIDSRLRLFDDGEFSVYYAPFESINERAKVVIVGLTPGFTQVSESYEKYREAFRAGMSHDDASRVAKQAASFAGAMRTNLISMLDGIGFPEALGLGSSEQLFSTHGHLLHATSALRYPVFRNGSNYSGTPLPTNHPALRSMIENTLGPELASFENAIYVPLGKAVTVAMDHLVTAQRLDKSRCLLGFPHPSGANGHRTTQYEKNRLDLRNQINVALAV